MNDRLTRKKAVALLILAALSVLLVYQAVNAACGASDSPRVSGPSLH